MTEHLHSRNFDSEVGLEGAFSGVGAQLSMTEHLHSRHFDTALRRARAERLDEGQEITGAVFHILLIMSVSTFLLLAPFMQN